MGRASGRHTARTPKIDPESGEGRAIGLSDRTQGVPSPIPGGEQHIVNAQTIRHPVPIPAAQPEHRGTMAHGVPPDSHTTRERAELMRGPNAVKPPAPLRPPAIAEKPIPVPVYIVQEGAGRRPLRIASMRHIIVPGFNGDPVRIVGRDEKRTAVKLMNNDNSTDLRIAHNPTALIQDPASIGGTPRTLGGILLVHGMTSYLKIETSDEVWAIAQHASNTVEVQIIMETSVIGSGAA